MNRQFCLLILCSLLGCSQSNYEVIQLGISKSSIPEGIVVHPISKNIFISSIHEDNITMSTPDGNQFSTILKRSDNGYTLGLGMDLWDDQLYALGSHERTHLSILSIVDLNSNLVSTFRLNEQDSTQFNDLAIDTHGNAFITDSKNNRILRFDKLRNGIELFLESEQFYYPNGICMTFDQSKLVVSSFTNGLRIIDIDRKKIINGKHEPTSNVGIDGLKYRNGVLYFIMNSLENNKIVSGLYQLKLKTDETDFEGIEPVLVNHEQMTDPTTISIVDDHIYILANSQLNNYDDKNKEIIDSDKLVNTYIIKLKIGD